MSSGALLAYSAGAPEFTTCVSGVRVAQSLIFCAQCFVDRCLTLCPFSLCLVYSSLALPEHLISISLVIGVRVAQSLVFCVVLSRSLFAIFLLSLVTTVL